MLNGHRKLKTRYKNERLSKNYTKENFAQKPMPNLNLTKNTDNSILVKKATNRIAHDRAVATRTTYHLVVYFLPIESSRTPQVHTRYRPESDKK